MAPLNNLDLQNPTNNESYGELSPLLLRIHQQNQEIDQQIEAIKNQRQEFETITENMSEGLILLNHDYHILSVNRSAIALLGAEERDYEGRHILELNRNLFLQKVAEKALRGEGCEETFTKDNSFSLVQGSPVYQDGVIKLSLIHI